MSDYIQLESLPNELFVEIFDYLSLCNLHQSFEGLNKRLNHILQSLTYRTLRVWSTDDNQKLEMNIFFASTIIALDINDECNINLNQYPNIRSLTYTYATDNQLQHFLDSTFCHTRLNYLNITSDDLSLIIQYFFSNQFPSLRQCILRNIDSIVMSPWRITPTPRSISICNDEYLISSILKSCQNLTHLSLSILEYSNTSSSTILHHQHLKHLSIEMTQPAWSIQAIDTLLCSIQIPQLVSFRILSYELSLIPFDFIQLANILNQHLPKLHRFECDILIMEPMIRDIDSFLFTRLRTEYRSDGVLRVYTNKYA